MNCPHASLLATMAAIRAELASLDAARLDLIRAQQETK